MKEKFTSVKAFVPTGAIAQVSKTKNIAFLSGQVSIDPETQEVVEGTMAQQTERVLENIRNIVDDMGLGMDSIIKCNVFISSMEKFDEFNEIYQKYFDIENPPARQTVTAGIWGNLDVEISAEMVLY
jgi:2-iminobutanoate/2-iminopropanoate deaminase